MLNFSMSWSWIQGVEKLVDSKSPSSAAQKAGQALSESEAATPERDVTIDYAIEDDEVAFEADSDRRVHTIQHIELPDVPDRDRTPLPALRGRCLLSVRGESPSSAHVCWPPRSPGSRARRRKQRVPQTAKQAILTFSYNLLLPASVAKLCRRHALDLGRGTFGSFQKDVFGLALSAISSILARWRKPLRLRLTFGRNTFRTMVDPMADVIAHPSTRRTFITNGCPPFALRNKLRCRRERLNLLSGKLCRLLSQTLEEPKNATTKEPRETPAGQSPCDDLSAERCARRSTRCGGLSGRLSGATDADATGRECVSCRTTATESALQPGARFPASGRRASRRPSHCCVRERLR